MDAENDVLMGWIREAGIESRVILLGEQRDVTAIMNGIDIFVLPSISEAFPLALGEAMSCGCYCIATDVGDCAKPSLSKLFLLKKPTAKSLMT